VKEIFDWNRIMEEIKITSQNRPSNDIVFGLVFEDMQIFKTTIQCILGEEIDETSYVVSQKENSMGSSIYNKIRFDVYAEGSKIYTVDMQNGYPQELIRKRLVYYACRAVGGQRIKKGRYDKLKTCAISFIFETSSYDSKRFMTEYYIASDDRGKIKQYSDLLTIVEVNLKYYKSTSDENLNILCEFLRVKDNKGLNKFYEERGDSEFGAILYERYIKVILDKDLMEEVGKMELYQEKMQLRYHTPAEADAILKQGEKKWQEETAKKLIKNNISVEIIVESTGLSVKRVRQMIKKHNTDK
jgi:predicted transposase/invertase (TIGR01784 family)